MEQFPFTTYPKNDTQVIRYIRVSFRQLSLQLVRFFFSLLLTLCCVKALAGPVLYQLLHHMCAVFSDRILLPFKTPVGENFTASFFLLMFSNSGFKVKFRPSLYIQYALHFSTLFRSTNRLTKCSPAEVQCVTVVLNILFQLSYGHT